MPARHPWRRCAGPRTGRRPDARRAARMRGAPSRRYGRDGGVRGGSGAPDRGWAAQDRLDSPGDHRDRDRPSLCARPGGDGARSLGGGFRSVAPGRRRSACRAGGGALRPARRGADRGLEQPPRARSHRHTPAGAGGAGVGGHAASAAGCRRAAAQQRRHPLAGRGGPLARPGRQRAGRPGCRYHLAAQPRRSRRRDLARGVGS